MSMTERLQLELYHTIPLVHALGLQVQQAQDGLVQFSAPLQANINDKGCAFGGSLASLLTLACWSVLRVETWARELSADIFVHTSDIVYRKPIWQDFFVKAHLDAEALEKFLQQFQETGKAAAILQAQAFVDDEPAVQLKARFVAMRPATE
jgi:thioesterase domain-containing protein